MLNISQKKKKSETSHLSILFYIVLWSLQLNIFVNDLLLELTPRVVMLYFNATN